MNWFLYAVMGTTIMAIFSVMTKRASKQPDNDAVIYVAWYKLLGGPVVALLAFVQGISLRVPSAYLFDAEEIAIWFAGVLIFSSGMVLMYKALPLVDISEMAVIGALQPFIVLLLGTFVFGESLTMVKLLAAVISFAAISLIYLEERRFTLARGQYYTLAAISLFALGSFIDKRLSVDLGSYPYFIYMSICVGLGTILLGRKSFRQVSRALGGVQARLIVFLAVLMAVGVLLTLKAYEAGGEASGVNLTLYLGTALVVLMGIIFLDERQKVVEKLIASAMIFAAMLLVA